MDTLVDDDPRLPVGLGEHGAGVLGVAHRLVAEAATVDGRRGSLRASRWPSRPGWRPASRERHGPGRRRGSRSLRPAGGRGATHHRSSPHCRGRPRRASRGCARPPRCCRPRTRSWRGARARVGMVSSPLGVATVTASTPESPTCTSTSSAGAIRSISSEALARSMMSRSRARPARPGTVWQRKPRMARVGEVGDQAHRQADLVGHPLHEPRADLGQRPGDSQVDDAACLRQHIAQEVGRVVLDPGLALPTRSRSRDHGRGHRGVVAGGEVRVLLHHEHRSSEGGCTEGGGQPATSSGHHQIGTVVARQSSSPPSFHEAGAS